MPVSIRPSKAYTFLPFTSRFPLCLHVSYSHRTLFSNIYFDHTGPERFVNANAFSTLGTDRYTAFDVYTNAARIGDSDGYIDFISNADVYPASPHADS
jgi:hypothetical protein